MQIGSPAYGDVENDDVDEGANSEIYELLIMQVGFFTS